MRLVGTSGLPSYVMSANGLKNFEAEKDLALSALVEATTDQDFKARADEVGAIKVGARRAASGAQDPKTLDDFNNAMRLKKAKA